MFRLAPEIWTCFCYKDTRAPVTSSQRVGRSGAKFAPQTAPFAGKGRARARRRSASSCPSSAVAAGASLPRPPPRLAGGTAPLSLPRPMRHVGGGANGAGSVV